MAAAECVQSVRGLEGNSAAPCSTTQQVLQLYQQTMQALMSPSLRPPPQQAHCCLAARASFLDGAHSLRQLSLPLF